MTDGRNSGRGEKFEDESGEKGEKMDLDKLMEDAKNFKPKKVFDVMDLIPMIEELRKNGASWKEVNEFFREKGFNYSERYLAQNYYIGKRKNKEKE